MLAYRAIVREGAVNSVVSAKLFIMICHKFAAWKCFYFQKQPSNKLRNN